MISPFSVSLMASTAPHSGHEVFGADSIPIPSLLPSSNVLIAIIRLVPSSVLSLFEGSGSLGGSI